MSEKFSQEEYNALYERLSVEFREKTARYRSLNTLCEKGQILFTGSSLMEAFPIVELAQGCGCGYKIYNRGIGGYTTTHFLDTIDVVLLDLAPSKIFINIGTNDISAPDYELKGLVQRYKTILDTIRSKLPLSQTYVMAYYPMNPNCGTMESFRGRTNARLQEANAAIEELVKSYKNCLFIDANDGLCDSDGNLKAEWTTDGIHMCPIAYDTVYKNLLPYIKGGII